jgi:hypothetical protein
MLTTYNGICKELGPLVPKLDRVGTEIDAVTTKLGATVQISSQQITDLTRVVQKFETYRASI